MKGVNNKKNVMPHLKQVKGSFDESFSITSNTCFLDCVTARFVSLTMLVIASFTKASAQLLDSA